MTRFFQLLRFTLACALVASVAGSGLAEMPENQVTPELLCADASGNLDLSSISYGACEEIGPEGELPAGMLVLLEAGTSTKLGITPDVFENDAAATVMLELPEEIRTFSLIQPSDKVEKRWTISGVIVPAFTGSFRMIAPPVEVIGGEYTVELVVEDAGGEP